MLEKKISKYLFNNDKIIKFKLSKIFFCSFNQLRNNSICFLKDNKDEYALKINLFKNVILITNKKNKNINKKIIQLIKLNPKNYFFDFIEKFYKNKNQFYEPKIGKNTIYSKNISIGQNVTIGENCKIYPNVVIADNVNIGNNCILKSNCIIGQKGFGLTRDKAGNLKEINHYGGVEIKNNVEIGALTTISQGTIDNTIINSYTKIDDHVHIGHNCIIGKNNSFCAGSIIGGSTFIGENNFFGLNCTIKNSLNIENNNFIAQFTSVTKNITSNKLVYGNPEKQVRNIFKNKYF